MSGTRCYLRSLYVAPGVKVRGYGADGRFEADAGEYGTVIGRTSDSGIQIVAPIGGRRTFRLDRRDDAWIFHVSNEWAMVTVNGEPLEPFHGRELCDGDEIAISGNLDHLHPDKPRGIARLVHRLRVEIETA